MVGHVVVALAPGGSTCVMFLTMSEFHQNGPLETSKRLAFSSLISQSSMMLHPSDVDECSTADAHAGIPDKSSNAAGPRGREKTY
jgi:hypothetical protein